jgi:hypothetical protein
MDLVRPDNNLEQGDKVETIVCTGCGKEKPDTDYNWHSKVKQIRRKQCRICQGIAGVEYYKNNINSRKVYLEENREKISNQRSTRLREDEEHAERCRARTRKWQANNRNHINKYLKNRYDNDPNYKMRTVLSARLRYAVVAQNLEKTVGTIELLGCSTQELRQHLEGQFREGMSWDTYGFYGWHVDHIRPCASFDLTQEDQQRACFHYSNLQPLWAKDNLSKGDKWEGEDEVGLYGDGKILIGAV